MKKLYYLICIACALITLSLNVRADVTIRFWDNGELIHTATEVDNAGSQFIQGNYCDTVTLRAVEHKLTACTGYKFLGWSTTPIINETTTSPVTDRVIVGTSAIDLYAVYSKSVTCYEKITSIDGDNLNSFNSCIEALCFLSASFSLLFLSYLYLL